MLKFVLVVVLFAAVVYTIAWTLERRRTLGKGNALPKRRVEAADEAGRAGRRRGLPPLAGPQAPQGRHGEAPTPDGQPDSKDGTDGQGQEPAAD